MMLPNNNNHYSPAELQTYLDQELEEAPKNLINQHLTGCLQCQEIVKELQANNLQIKELFKRSNSLLVNVPQALERFRYGEQKDRENSPALQLPKEKSGKYIHPLQQVTLRKEGTMKPPNFSGKVRQSLHEHLPSLSAIAAGLIVVLGLAVLITLTINRSNPMNATSTSQSGNVGGAVPTPTLKMTPTAANSATCPAGAGQTNCTPSKSFPLNLTQVSNGISVTLIQGYYGDDGAFVRYEVNGLKDAQGNLLVGAIHSVGVRDTKLEIAQGQGGTYIELGHDNQISYSGTGSGNLKFGSFFKTSRSIQSGTVKLRFTIGALVSFQPQVVYSQSQAASVDKVSDQPPLVGSVTPIFQQNNPSQTPVSSPNLPESLLSNPLIWEFEIPFGPYNP